jgi:uncharacterized membrane protein YgcG
MLSSVRARWLWVGLALLGCSSGNGPRIDVGKPDQTSAGNLRVDEVGLRGDVRGGALHLQIPLHNIGPGAGQGNLAVSVGQLDGTEPVSRPAPYQLQAGQDGVAEVDLPLPAQIKDQADWVKYRVVVTHPRLPALRVTRSLLAVVPPYEVRLEGPGQLVRGKLVRYRVRAQDPVTFRLLPKVPVKLELRREGKVIATMEATTGDKGDAIFQLTPDSEGPVQVTAHAALQGTAEEVADDATVNAPGGKVLLTTDKPLYQPGQTMHLRALALDPGDGKPLAGQPVLFEILDGKGNKITKRTITSSSYGLAAMDFTLGSVLNMGNFQVRATVGKLATQKTVQVGRYVLPKFKVAVAQDKPYYKPGDTVSGTVDARYFFGKPVAMGDVVIEGSALDIGLSTFGRVMGKTDADGKFTFSMALPGALVGLPIADGAAVVNLAVAVTDGAGQEVEQQTAVRVVSNPLRLALVPEATVLVSGVENRLDLFVTDPTGAPVANASATISVGQMAAVRGQTDEFGRFSFTATPGPDDTGAQVGVQTKEGLEIDEHFDLAAQNGSVPVLVRTDRAVYGIGDTVTVDITTATDRSAVYVDWLNDGQVVDMRTLDVVKGKAHFTVAVDSTMAGGNRIEAYVVGPDGNIVRAGRSIFARSSGALTVDLTADQPSYTPGAPARLTWSVKDETGAPAVAALGVQIVDQAVFALVDAQPGLLRTYFELEDQFAQPHYELRAPAGDLPSLLFDDTAARAPGAAAAAQARAAATLAALGDHGMMGISRSSRDDLAGNVNTRLQPFLEKEQKRLQDPVRRALKASLDALALHGCTINDSSGCDSGDFFPALTARMNATLTVADFWGNRWKGEATWDTFRLASAGPNEKDDGDDDQTLSFSFSDLMVNPDRPTPGSAADAATSGPAFDPTDPRPGNPNNGGGNASTGGSSGGFGGAGGSTGSGGTGSGSSEEPRVRNNFPETLYTNPQLITGPDGKATVTVDMADSITDWRVSSLAHTLGGKLGGGVGAVRVFQEFFVDIDFPATLTRGDQVSFPVAVYNYLMVPQTVHLQLEAADWFTVTGQTTRDVALAPGQVTSVRFPVQVNKVGRQVLTVKALGGQRSDAVARSVLVVPDGKLVSTARSGSLASGTTTQTAAFPATAVPGSQRLYLDVFPAYLAQVVKGMDSMLQVPNGCFEQTTSTAWPNVLVTDYLKKTNQLKPEIALKAESLMSAGYQRLLTFEHKGGGFSWFGEQDPEPYLSVTAFGLMEFSDMAKVHPVDEAMIDRTRRWLLSQQNADGSWKGDMTEFFDFQTSLARNTAFVVWALAASGYSGPEVGRGLDYVKKNSGKEGMDPYSLALIANAFATAAPNDPALSGVLGKLDAMKKVDGAKISWDSGNTQTNFYGSGPDAGVATTALVAHALLLTNGDKTTLDGAMAFLAASRDSGGNFGSTQATIWTLRALLLSASKGSTGAEGTFTVSVDDHPFPTLTLTKEQADVMTTIDLGALATTGEHRVALTFAGTGKVSYNLVAEHNLPWAMAPDGANGPLAVTVSYDKTRLALDDVATATVTVRNRVASPQAMVLVTVGLPPGFQVMTEDLDAYVADRKLSRYELTGKQLLLYVSALAKSEALDISYRLRAVTPVRASDGGTQAYLYYAPEQRTSAPATMLEVMGN